MPLSDIDLIVVVVVVAVIAIFQNHYNVFPAASIIIVAMAVAVSIRRTMKYDETSHPSLFYGTLSSPK